MSFKCVMIIIKISLPDNVLDPLRDEDEEEEEEEVGGGVADELQEGLSHRLQRINAMIKNKMMITRVLKMIITRVNIKMIELQMNFRRA